ncbi:hypothetical protein NECID01_2074 [Nematocida sp. AWRm77]|nr:hypothetical protein NECID01_2074 [Nematocida sp. AWRm77]
MHLQRTILIAICVSLICFDHRSYTMNNPELHEGVRKRANDQPSIDQFEGPTLTRHAIDTKKLDAIIAEEFRREREEIERKKKEEEDKKTILDHGAEWIVKNQDDNFKMLLLVIGLGFTLWVLSQLAIFVSADAAAIVKRNFLPRRWYLHDYYYNNPNTYNSSNVIIERVTEVAEVPRKMDRALESIQTEM